MSQDALTGRVVVVAGAGGPLLVDAVAQLTRCGVLLAVVSAAPGIGAEDDTAWAPVVFRADPSDMSVWDRIAPHVEQRLGPVDAVVADSDLLEPLRTVFAADMDRRGHGTFVALAAGDDVVTVLRQALLGRH